MRTCLELGLVNEELAKCLSNILFAHKLVIMQPHMDPRDCIPEADERSADRSDCKRMCLRVPFSAGICHFV